MLVSQRSHVFLGQLGFWGSFLLFPVDPLWFGGLSKLPQVKYYTRMCSFWCHVLRHVSVCTSYHGLGVWFPDMVKYLQYEDYESKVRMFHRERVERFHFNFSLINQVHKEGEYIHDK